MKPVNSDSVDPDLARTGFPTLGNTSSSTPSLNVAFARSRRPSRAGPACAGSCRWQSRGGSNRPSLPCSPCASRRGSSPVRSVSESCNSSLVTPGISARTSSSRPRSITSTLGACAWNGQPMSPRAGKPMRDISPRERRSKSTSISSKGLSARGAATLTGTFAPGAAFRADPLRLSLVFPGRHRHTPPLSAASHSGQRCHGALAGAHVVAAPDVLAHAITAVASGPSPSSSSTPAPSGEHRTTQTRTRRGPPPGPSRDAVRTVHALVRLQIAIVRLDEETPPAGVADPPVATGRPRW